MDFMDSTNLYRKTQKIMNTLKPILIKESKSLNKSDLANHATKLTKLNHLINDYLTFRRINNSIDTHDMFKTAEESDALLLCIVHTTEKSVQELKKSNFSRQSITNVLRCLKTYKKLYLLVLSEYGITPD